MYRNGLISGHIWEVLAKPIKQHADALAEVVSEALYADPSVEEEILNTTMREILVSQRNALNTLLRNGIISEETYAKLVVEVDTALTSPQAGQIGTLLNKQLLPIDGLMAVIVQDSDIENVNAVLNRLGNPATRLSSSGGFLGRKNTTLFVAVPKGKEWKIMETIESACQKRVEFLPPELKKSENETSVTIEGAAIFTFDVDRFEEL